MKTPQIRALVDQFVADLSEAIHREALEAVRGALGDGVAPARRGPGRPRKASKRGPGRPRKKATKRGRKATKKASGGRRSPEEVEALGEVVLAHVKSNPGQRLEEIGRDLGMPTAELKRPIANLMEAGKLRTEGQKRGTKYFAGGRGKKAAKKVKKRVSKRKTAKKKATRKKATKRKKKTTTRKAG